MRCTYIALLSAVLLLSLGACKGPAAAPPGGVTPVSAEPPPDARKPRGWKAYSGTRTVGVEGMGPAADATVFATDGASVQLSSTWAEQPAMLIFYRGHW